MEKPHRCKELPETCMPALTPRLEPSRGIQVWVSVTVETGLQYLATQSVVQGPADLGVDEKGTSSGLPHLNQIPSQVQGGPADPQSLGRGRGAAALVTRSAPGGTPSIHPLGSAE